MWMNARNLKCELNAPMRLHSVIARSEATKQSRLSPRNPDCHRGETLDCFAALAMTTLRKLRAKIHHPRAEEAAERPSRSTRANGWAFILRDAVPCPETGSPMAADAFTRQLRTGTKVRDPDRPMDRPMVRERCPWPIAAGRQSTGRQSTWRRADRWYGT